VLRHGYVVACVDARGSGASFGRFEGMFSQKETQDSYDPAADIYAALPLSSV